MRRIIIEPWIGFILMLFAAFFAVFADSLYNGRNTIKVSYEDFSDSGFLPLREYVTEAFAEDEYMSEEYLEIVSAITEKGISDDRTDVISEFVLLYSGGQRGVWYLNIREYSDKTGRVSCKYSTNMSIDSGFLICDNFIMLEESDTGKILSIFDSNRFFEEPSIHAEDNPMQDGFSVFVEGFKDGRYKVIGMNNPEDVHPVSVLYNSVSAVAGELGLSYEFDEEMLAVEEEAYQNYIKDTLKGRQWEE